MDEGGAMTAPTPPVQPAMPKDPRDPAEAMGDTRRAGWMLVLLGVALVLLALVLLIVL